MVKTFVFDVTPASLDVRAEILIDRMREHKAYLQVHADHTTLCVPGHYQTDAEQKMFCNAFQARQNRALKARRTLAGR